MNNLINGRLYWIMDHSNQVYLSEYRHERYFRVSWFSILGMDDNFEVEDVEVLGEVDLVVPEYAKETGYGN
jgi:hypothetical protein